VIYPTEAVNDQVITTPSIWRAGYFGSPWIMGAGNPRLALMQCGIAGERTLRW
jgi:hypothetical protein